MTEGIIDGFLHLIPEQEMFSNFTIREVRKRDLKELCSSEDRQGYWEIG